MLTWDNQIVGPWVAAKVDTSLSDRMSSLGWLDREGKITAGVVYDHYTFASIAATIAVEGTINRQFLRAIFDYPFNQLGVKKIVAYVAESNLRSIRFLRKAGFKREAALKDIYEDGDMYVYMMTRVQCRWIGEGNGKEI